MATPLKTITFIIPAYNSGDTLRHCLDSFLVDALLDEMEILIVNDGSTDETSEIAGEYVQKYTCFELINKANGGHGSVINLAAPKARGRYFKVIDSDDRINKENLPMFLSRLRTAEADVVLTHFRMNDIRSGQNRDFKMSGIHFDQTTDFTYLWKYGHPVAKLCCFHGITYRTCFYRACGISLSENISYEDQEYALLPLLQAKTILPLDLFIYEYYVGYANQSMSEANQVKRIDQLASVFWKIENYTLPSMSESAKAFYAYQRRELLLVCYVTALIKNPDKRAGRHWAKRLRRRVKGRDKKLSDATRLLYGCCRLLSWLGLDASFMKQCQEFRWYQFLAQKLLRK